MADSNSWRDLAAQFLALPRPQGDIHARWKYTAGSGVVGNWTLGGDLTLEIQFDALARRAAIGLPDKRSSDLLIAWLEAIRMDGRGFEILNSFPTEMNDDGSRGATYCLGSIRGVCEASVNLCRALESLALQAEFEAKQRAQVTPQQAAQIAERFRPLDENYQTIEFEGSQYDLTRTQSIVVRVLHEASLAKRRSAGIKEIHKALGIQSGKMSDWFRGKNKNLYPGLIVQSGSRKHYRLDL